MQLVTWSKRVQNFDISRKLAKFRLGCNYLIRVQVWLKTEFYENLTMEKSWIWLHFGEYISFRGTCSLGQSCFNPCVTWPDDYAISHDYCIWSYILFPAQNFYLKSSIFRRSDFIISLCSLLFVLCLWKSRDLINTRYGKRRLVWAN